MPALQMHIRPATSADIPSLMTLERQAPTAAHWSLPQYQAAFSSAAPSRVALVIEDESGTQGFLMARAAERQWEIENVAVAIGARRRGLGTRLIGEFLSVACGQGAAAVFLEVRESNAAARRLYEKCGFVEDGRRKRYYRDPEEDAISYRLLVAS